MKYEGAKGNLSYKLCHYIVQIDVSIKKPLDSLFVAISFKSTRLLEEPFI